MAESENTVAPHDADEGTDLISELPSAIIHTILNRLNSPEEAARTCVLSKTWYGQIWRSYPVVEYRNRNPDTYPGRYAGFRSFADSSSKRLLSYFKLPDREPLAALRISSVVCVVQRLDELFSSFCGSPSEVSLEIDGWQYYPLRSEAMFRICSRTRILSLKGCKLEDDCFGDGSFGANARRLESLSLESVRGIEKLEICDVSFRNLEMLKIGRRVSAKEIKLTAAPFLQTLELNDCKLRIVSSSAAPVLKKLRIANCKKFRQQDLDGLISNLPALEVLSFHDTTFTSGWCSLRVRAPRYKLREFSLVDCQWAMDGSLPSPLMGLKVDAPNLATLYYTDRRMDFPIMEVNVVNVALNLRLVVGLHCRSKRMHCYYDDLKYGWFVGLKLVLSSFTSQFQHSLVLKMREPEPDEQVLSSKTRKHRVPWDRMMNPEFVGVEHLQLEAGTWKYCQLGEDRHLLDGFFSICRPKFVSVVRNRPISLEHWSQFIEYVCRHLTNKSSANCCDGTECWRHFLEDVKIKSDGKMVAISEEVTSSVVGGEQMSIDFMLTWHTL